MTEQQVKKAAGNSTGNMRETAIKKEEMCRVASNTVKCTVEIERVQPGFAGGSESMAKEALEGLKAKYSIATPAKQASTLLLAILRACISRGINFTGEELLI